ncbi:MAG TPA: winged helix-turn-helix domain-containing protein, partial [Stellaceae bacterium]
MRYIFDGNVLDVERRELWHGTDQVHVAPQVFDLLEYLIRNRDQVVTKDELVAAIWGGRAISDSALTTRMNVLRRMIGDSGERQRLIATVTRKGFRFVGAVREERSVPERNNKTFIDPWRPIPALPERPSIAVLPFADESEELDAKHCADCLAEDVLTELTKQRWLIVVARNVSFATLRTTSDARQVGSELGVRYVLEGNVRRIENRIRFTVRLTDAVAGVHVWADYFDGLSIDRASVHDRIIETIVAAVVAGILRT